MSLAVLLSLPMLAEQVEIDGINYDLVAEACHIVIVCLVVLLTVSSPSAFVIYIAKILLFLIKHK